MIQNNYNNQMQTLPITFIPGPSNVICGRGKKTNSHSGNQFYQNLIRNTIPQYCQAISKHEKTMLVSDILMTIKTNGPDSGFIKKKQTDDGCCCYYHVSDQFAREKIGQNLRDYLSNKYRSSTKAKRKRRVAGSTKRIDTVDDIVQSNQFVNKRMKRLTTTIVERNGTESIPDFYINQLFIQTNREILEAFKNNEGLLQKFIEAENDYKLE